VVIRDARDTDSYLSLDGHLRIEVLRDLDLTEVELVPSGMRLEFGLAFSWSHEVIVSGGEVNRLIDRDTIQ
jgi:hypothetical protein